MKHRVHIADELSFSSDLSVYVLQDGGPENRYVGRVSDEYGHITWERVEPGTTARPTVRLSEEVARALLEALLVRFSGSQDLHTVRADLLHERGRVDKMLETIQTLACRPQNLQVYPTQERR